MICPLLDELFDEWLLMSYDVDEPDELPVRQQIELKRAFIAGTFAVLTELPIVDTDDCLLMADRLVRQCRAFVTATLALPDQVVLCSTESKDGGLTDGNQG